jgi:hypothetical protein
MRKWFAAAACTVAIMGVGTTGAFAGEVTGPFPNGHTLWTGTITDANGNVLGHTLNGNSICAFSGLNIPSEDGDPSRVQSYGQVVKSVVESGGKGSDLGGIPGTACNGHTGDLVTGGGQ